MPRSRLWKVVLKKWRRGWHAAPRETARHRSPRAYPLSPCQCKQQTCNPPRFPSLKAAWTCNVPEHTSCIAHAGKDSSRTSAGLWKMMHGCYHERNATLFGSAGLQRSRTGLAALWSSQQRLTAFQTRKSPFTSFTLFCWLTRVTRVIRVLA